MSWQRVFYKYLEQVCQSAVTGCDSHFSRLAEGERQAVLRDRRRLKERKATVVKVTFDGRVFSRQRLDDMEKIGYFLHVRRLIRQKGIFYLEEKVEKRRAVVENDKILQDELHEDKLQEGLPRFSGRDEREVEAREFVYHRLEAVRYAETWWNSYNPRYRAFEVDCTNFVSQCLHAGGAPMRGAPNRSKGWWYSSSSWSYSWAVAHAMRWYFAGSEKGLRAREVENAEDLFPGDVICYDFDGDGHFQHTTIVVARDADRQPLVNAHTTNSRMRHWRYEDSTAWTKNIQYKFFHIVDDR